MSTWGFGDYGASPVTMAGWGLLATTPIQTVTLDSVSITQPTVTASVTQPTISTSVTQSTVTITEKNDIT